MKAIKHPKRTTYLSKHHIHPKNRGGHKHPSNILRLWRDKHDSFHFVFGNLNLGEIIFALKTNQKPISITCKSKHWQFLWGSKTFDEIIAILSRVKRLKKRLKHRAATTP